MAEVGNLNVSLTGDSKQLEATINQSKKLIQDLALAATKAQVDLSKFSAQTIGGLGWSKELGGKVNNLLDFSNIIPKKEIVSQLQDTQRQITSGMSGFSQATMYASTQQANFDKGMKQLSSDMWVATMGLRQLGTNMSIAFTVPLAALATISIKTFADIESGMKRLQAITNESVGKGLVEQFRQLSLVMPTTIKDFEQMAIVATQAGVASENLKEYVVTIAKMKAVSPELDIKQTAEALISVSTAFGIAQEKVGAVASVLQLAAKESKGGIDDFTAALLRAAPSAATLGVSFTDLTAILGAVVPVAGSATRAGTEINIIFDQMIKNLPKLAEQMGITEEALKKMIGEDPVSALKQYIEGLKVSGDQIENNQAILEVFGQNGAKALRLLISQYDVFIKKQAEYVKEGQAPVELNKEFSIASDTLANTFILFGNAIKSVAYSIGQDLNPIIGKFLTTTIKGLVLIQSLWDNIPGPIKSVAFAIAAILASAGPLILAFNVLWGVAAGLVTTFVRMGLVSPILAAETKGLTLSFATLGTVVQAVLIPFLEFIAIAALVAGAIYLILDALGLWDGIAKQFDSILGDVNKKMTGFGDIGTNVSDQLGSAADEMQSGVSKIAFNASKWGDDIMSSLISGFSKADFSVLDDSMKVVESYFSLLKDQSGMTENEIYNSTLSVRRLIASSISEIKTLGAVGEETRRKLESSLGAPRTGAIIESLLSGIGVSKIQDTVDSLEKELQKNKDSLSSETKVLDTAIKSKEKEWDKQINAEQKIVDGLQKQRKANEKIYNTDLKIRETTVDAAQSSVDLEKDKLDSIKKANDLIISNLQDQKDILSQNVDDAKSVLNQLQDLQQQEVDNAEGMLDYQKMNLEAAQNQLKKEVALGHDEFNSTYQAALARTNAADDQVNLAYSQYIKTKQSYAKEIKVAKSKVDAEQTLLDQKEAEIKSAQKQADALEAIQQQAVDIQQKSLDAAKNELDIFKKAYSEKDDLLQEELDIHQEKIDNFKDQKDESLNLLKEEKDAVQEKYDKEIEILDAKLTAEKANLEKSKKANEALQAIIDENLKQEQAMQSAMQEGASKFANQAAGFGTNKASGNKTPIMTPAPWAMSSMAGGTQKKQSFKDKFLQTTGLPDFSITPLDLLTGKAGVTGQFSGSAADTITQTISKPFIDAGNLIGDSLYQTYLDVQKTWQTDITPMLSAIWANLSASAQTSWETIKSTISSKSEDIKSISSQAWSDILASLSITGINIQTTWGKVWDTAKTKFSTVWAEMNKNFDTVLTWGSKMVAGITNGIDWNKIKNIGVSIADGIMQGLNSNLNSIKDWGKNLIKTIFDGIKEKLKDVKDIPNKVAQLIANSLEMHSPAKEGPLSTADEWMPNLMKMFADGIMGNTGILSNAADVAAGVLSNIPGDVTPNYNTGVLNNLPDLLSQAQSAIPAQSGKTVNYNIKPGMMIASEGEVRAFARLLNTYLATEETRYG